MKSFVKKIRSDLEIVSETKSEAKLNNNIRFLLTFILSMAEGRLFQDRLAKQV